MVPWLASLHLQHVVARCGVWMTSRVSESGGTMVAKFDSLILHAQLSRSTDFLDQHHSM